MVAPLGAMGRGKERSGSSWQPRGKEFTGSEGEIDKEGQWAEYLIALLPGWTVSKAPWFYNQNLQADIPRGVWKSVSALNSCFTRETVKGIKLLLCFGLGKMD